MTCRYGFVVVMALAVGFAVVVASPTPAATFPLDARSLSTPANQVPESGAERLAMSVSSQTVFMRVGGQLPDQAAFNEAVRKQPAWKCAAPIKGLLRIGDGRVPVVLDSSDLEKEGFNRLVIDKNGNGDLTDDAAIEAKPSQVLGSSSRPREFPDVELTVKAGDVSYRQVFRASSYYYKLQDGDQAQPYGYGSFSSRVYRQGEITLDGRKLTVMLVDFNANGRFDDSLSMEHSGSDESGKVYPSSSGDRLYWNISRVDTRLSPYAMSTRRDMSPVCGLVGIEGKFYTLKVTPSGDQLTLAPTDKPLGKLKNDSPSWSAILYGSGGVVKISGDKGQPAAVPAGDWKLLEYTSIAPDEQLTYLTAQGTQKSPAIDVNAGQTVALPFGAPYKPVVVMGSRERMVNSRPVRDLEMRLVGAGEEICSALTVHGRQPAGPTFVIADAAGKKAESGAFQFG